MGNSRSNNLDSSTELNNESKSLTNSEKRKILKAKRPKVSETKVTETKSRSILICSICNENLNESKCRCKTIKRKSESNDDVKAAKSKCTKNESNNNFKTDKSKCLKNEYRDFKTEKPKCSKDENIKDSSTSSKTNETLTKSLSKKDKLKVIKKCKIKNENISKYVKNLQDLKTKINKNNKNNENCSRGEISNIIKDKSETTDQKKDVQNIAKNKAKSLKDIIKYKNFTLQQKENDEKDISIKNDTEIIQEIYIVIDTNILLKDIEVLQSLRATMYFGKSMKIIIPYIVLQELDGLKNNESVQANARSAIRWFNNHLENDDLCIIGQDYEHYLKAIEEFGGSKGDDAILSCCLLYKKQDKKVYLLSNDINLRNKLIVSKVKSFDASKQKALIEKKIEREKAIITPKSNSTEKQQKITNTHNISLDNCNDQNQSTLTDLNESIDSTISNATSIGIKEPKNCEKKTAEVIKKEDCLECIIKYMGPILEKAMKDAYGDNLWLSIVLYKPPWSAIQILECFEKHYIAVFLEKYSNHVLTMISHIKKSLRSKNLLYVSGKLPQLFCIMDKEFNSRISNIELNKNSLLPEPSEAFELKTEDTEKVIGPIEQAIVDVGQHSNSFFKETFSYLQTQGEKPDLLTVRSSLELFRSTLMFLGFTLQKLKENVDSPSQLLKEQLETYWRLAQRNDELKTVFTNEEMNAFGSSEEGQQFYANSLTELEIFIQNIDEVLNSVNDG